MFDDSILIFARFDLFNLVGKHLFHDSRLDVKFEQMVFYFPLLGRNTNRFRINFPRNNDPLINWPKSLSLRRRPKPVSSAFYLASCSSEIPVGCSLF